MVPSFFRRRRKLTQLNKQSSLAELLSLFDVFYVCYDEPNRVANWQQVQKVIPSAQKVEGVVGFDQALKTCAKKSKTDYFFLIDGDNQLLPSRFSQQALSDEVQDHYVLSWSSLNPVNGLAYGNGGLKLWPKKVASKINSHESAQGEDDQTDYCFIADYYLIDNYATETHVNSTYKQAFRAGFREGVKMSLAWGRQVSLDWQNYESLLGRQNRQRLKVWCEIGDDCLNGCWGILGARMGLLKNLEGFDYKNINSYEWIDECLRQEVLSALQISPAEIEALSWNKKRLKDFSVNVAVKINKKIPIDIQEYTPLESLSFKRGFQNPSRRGLLGRQPRL